MRLKNGTAVLRKNAPGILHEPAELPNPGLKNGSAVLRKNAHGVLHEYRTPVLPEMRLELTLGYPKGILSPLRLPIPPLRPFWYCMRVGTSKSTLLEKALDVALQAHRGQTDRAGGAYITHPLRMMGRTKNPDEQIVAVLHDCVEDGLQNGVTLQTIRDAGFPAHIVAAVDALTRRTTASHPDIDQDEPYEAFVERASADPLARAVKLLDLADNMDLTRLPSIGDDDVERMRRYRAAWLRITGT